MINLARPVRARQRMDAWQTGSRRAVVLLRTSRLLALSDLLAAHAPAVSESRAYVYFIRRRV